MGINYCDDADHKGKKKTKKRKEKKEKKTLDLKEAATTTDKGKAFQADTVCGSYCHALGLMFCVQLICIGMQVGVRPQSGNLLLTTQFVTCHKLRSKLPL